MPSLLHGPYTRDLWFLLFRGVMAQGYWPILRSAFKEAFTIISFELAALPGNNAPLSFFGRREGRICIAAYLCWRIDDAVPRHLAFLRPEEAEEEVDVVVRSAASVSIFITVLCSAGSNS